jgi:hypothetical protein
MAYEDDVLLFAPRGAITAAELVELTEAGNLRGLMDAIEACGFKNNAEPLISCVEWIELRRRLSLPPSFSPNAAG